MSRSTVMSLPLQLVFPGMSAHLSMLHSKIKLKYKTGVDVSVSDKLTIVSIQSFNNSCKKFYNTDQG
jgi:hypothetical protein